MNLAEQLEFLTSAVELAETAELSSAHDARLRALVVLLRMGLARVTAEGAQLRRCGCLPESAGEAE